MQICRVGRISAKYVGVSKKAAKKHDSLISFIELFWKLWNFSSISVFSILSNLSRKRVLTTFGVPWKLRYSYKTNSIPDKHQRLRRFIKILVAVSLTIILCILKLIYFFSTTLLLLILKYFTVTFAISCHRSSYFHMVSKTSLYRSSTQ